jgi:hypothetical protein
MPSDDKAQAAAFRALESDIVDLARSARIASYLEYNPPDISPDPDDAYADLSRHAGVVDDRRSKEKILCRLRGRRGMSAWCTTLRNHS